MLNVVLGFFKLNVAFTYPFIGKVGDDDAEIELLGLCEDDILADKLGDSLLDILELGLCEALALLLILLLSEGEGLLLSEGDAE